MNFGWKERRGVVNVASVASFNFQFPLRAV